MKKIVLAGAGARGRSMFALPFVQELQNAVCFCGIYDRNSVRSRLLSEECGGIPVFGDYFEMLKTVQPDMVVVTSPDYTHHEMIIAALEAGCDVVSEKPMTTDADKCRAILDAERRTGKTVTVTFNMRYMPYMARIKELVLEGAVGDIQHISLEWFLDRSHGADYFRRWHSRLDWSGGLLVHKSTHHFDIVNWWLNDDPEIVSAFGSRRFYGPTREERGERCLTCRHQSTCEFYRDFRKDEMHSRYYFQAEHEDGYFRDRCVFDDKIDIYDNMSVQVQYAKGALLTYSLVAYSPYEGWRVVISGSKGRLEGGEQYSGLLGGKAYSTLAVFKPNGEVVDYRIPAAYGGHGGGDERLRRMLFNRGSETDPLGRQAGSKAGAMSLLIGAGSNISIAEGRIVRISELLYGTTNDG